MHRHFAVAVGIIACAGITLSAQWRVVTKGVPMTPVGTPNFDAAAPKLADGTPDFSGIWDAEKRPCNEMASVRGCLDSLTGNPIAFGNISATVSNIGPGGKDLSNGGLATAYYYLHEYERAISQLEKTLDLDPAHGQMYLYLGRSYLGARRLDEAVKVLERGTGLPAADMRMRGILGYAYAIMGKHADAHRLLDEIEVGSKLRYPSLGLFSATFVHVGLGQYDQALDGLERLCAERSTLVHWLKTDPLYDPLHSNPRFENILRRMGVSQ